MKRICNKAFMSRHKTLMSQQSQEKFSIILSRLLQTMLRHNCRKGTEKCRDITLQAMTKLENKDGSYVATKQPTGPDFWGSIISTLKCGP